jgi:hypothetical protein
MKTRNPRKEGKKEGSRKTVTKTKEANKGI